MGPYQRRLEGINPEWKRNIHIPAKAAQGTARKLRLRLEALHVALRRTGDIRAYSLDHLFAEWFERSAELILKRHHPEIHAAIRAAQDRAHAEAEQTCPTRA